eukprot:CAMPEP_0119524194 /NCGR_PEP_ID=MMETSP1344-20130328/39172_1 /TAXON_ID=236787 /ORGANISM="Florenciella parvula, Strain CCMP2471" /LENGTH=402 /DNA_ID=CAMNT_0007562647 /DNA_START=113 /DNA_END=1321 /DNA_ORIENTATION=+
MAKTAHKLATAPFPAVPAVCVVTGGSGFVGQRLVEMLVERGAKKVISFDIAPKPADAWDRKEIEYVQGDISDRDHVFRVVSGADCVWHNAAAVGPYHPEEVYYKVNYEGTLHVIDACKHHGCKKLVFSSSPSTRFDGSDVDGLTEDEMPSIPQKKYLQDYAKTKAMAEVAVTGANSAELMTVAIAPHQVYGPRDNLFLPNMLETAGQGLLRIFGNGKNRICFSHVDNYAHGLILGYPALYPGSPACGKFYIVTDGSTHADPRGCCDFWVALDEMVMAMGFVSIWSKSKLPRMLLMIIAHICDFVGMVLGVRIKLNPFAVKVLTMHRWFDISAAEKDLKYLPVIPFDEGWKQTGEWFKANWLPKFNEAQKTGKGKRVGGIAKQSDDKINLATEGVKKTIAKSK